jgi:hypothetical protein
MNGLLFVVEDCRCQTHNFFFVSLNELAGLGMKEKHAGNFLF